MKLAFVCYISGGGLFCWFFVFLFFCFWDFFVYWCLKKFRGGGCFEKHSMLYLINLGKCHVPIIPNIAMHSNNVNSKLQYAVAQDAHCKIVLTSQRTLKIIVGQK